MTSITATAHPNIALAKYWGKRDTTLNLPAVPSLSLTLDGFTTTTTVHWGAKRDWVMFRMQDAELRFAKRVLSFLDLVDPDRPPCRVETDNDFPTGAGLASSASGFAALALAATRAAGQDLRAEALSALARRGSGSACRSLFGGWVEWQMGTATDGSDSHGHEVAAADHWDVAMVIAVVSRVEKTVGSTDGMERTRATSPYFGRWVETAPADVVEAREAVLAKDLGRLGAVTERSMYKMHATLHTSDPPVVYWKPSTVACLHAVAELRRNGTGAWATMDAGPNVKVLCERGDADTVAAALRCHVDDVVITGPGGAPTVVG